ncbi:MAG: hypothetical protein KGL74_07960 [Elusimicrobia bacterium]|nr:hypothetical protein [Elusimicrobiota bacterium]MDE2511041.1 hypothetical protein [Elusimicrobiota bacterium]
MEGILATGEDGETTLQVSSDGFVDIDTATIVRVLKQTPEENAALKEKWARQDRREDENDPVSKKFAQKQRELGLVPYHDTWITPAALDRRLVLERLENDIAQARARSPQGGLTVNVNPILLLENASPASGFYGRSENNFAAPAPPRINEFSSSGNFIRRSEFARPSAHDGKTFDPATGLYR